MVSAVCRAYILFFRGTPLLMQLFFIYYTLPQLVPALNIQSRFFAAWLAFTLNVAAYLAEIIRAAIESIDKGQMEASRALGLTHSQAMRLVIIPQAYRRMIPADLQRVRHGAEGHLARLDHRADRPDLPDQDHRLEQGERASSTSRP